MNPNQSKSKCYFCEELCLWFLETFCLLWSDLQFLQKYCSQSKHDSVPEPPMHISHGFKLLLAFKLWRLFIYQWLNIRVLRKPPEDMTRVARREKKKRKTKNNTEKHHRKWNKGKRIHLGHNRKKSQQQRRVEETCPCPMCHEVYQVLKKICTIGKLADYKETVLNKIYKIIKSSNYKYWLIQLHYKPTIY
jgi:hypothetical protein